jgi:hypothetical protein
VGPEKSHLNTLLKFEVIWAKGKPKLTLSERSESNGEFRKGAMFPDKSRNKFQVSIHWEHFLFNISLCEQRNIRLMFAASKRMNDY